MVAVDESKDYDLAELVDVGVIPAIVMDDHKARLYGQTFENIRLHPDIAIHAEDEIACAVRKGSPELTAAVDAHQVKAVKGTEIGNILLSRWLKSPERVRNAIAPGKEAKFEETIGFIWGTPAPTIWTRS